MERRKGSFWWGGLLVLLGIVLLLESLGIVSFVSRLVWALILIGIGSPFWYIYLSDRNQWWALIPGCVMVGVGLGVLLGGTLAGIIITASVSLPFWLIYLADRRNWWALIPGWVMASVSAIIVLGWIGLGWLVAPFVMFSIAAPFILVYFLNRSQWWALIPGGIMAAIGLLLLTGAVLGSGVFLPVALILLGFWLIYRTTQRRPIAESTPLPPEPLEPEAPPTEPR